MTHLITQNQIKVCDLIVANVEVVHLRSTWYNFHPHVLRTINMVYQHCLTMEPTCFVSMGFVWRYMAGGFGALGKIITKSFKTKQSSTIPQSYPVSNSIFLSITCHRGSIYFFGFFFFLCVMEWLDKIGVFSISISHKIIMRTLLVYLSFFHNDNVIASRQKLQRKEGITIRLSY